MSNLLFKLATLASQTGSSTDLTDSTKWEWVTTITDFLRTLLPYLLIIVLTAGTIYAVVLGVKMAKAEDASAREEAKKRIINFIIALAITVLLIILLQVVADNLPKWLDITLPESDVVGVVLVAA